MNLATTACSPADTSATDAPSSSPATKTPARVFCVAPWVNSYRGTDGFRSLCCITTSLQADYETFDTWWNGPEMREARRTFLAGGVPAVCSACIDSNRTSGSGYNQSFLNNFGHHLPEIFAKTYPDGRTEFQPRAIDYRTIHCNLKCRTCDARNSSSIRTEVIKHKGWLPTQARSVDSEWWLEGGTLETVDYVYWAGGEPLMSPVHTRVMRTLMESGRASEISVDYTSNLMHLNERLLDDLARYAESFKIFSIGASIDGLGEVGAYVRSGWNHETFFRNVDVLRARAPRLHLYFDFTLTNLGLLSLPGLLQESARRGMDLQCKLMERNGVNDFLHIDFISPKLIEQVLRYSSKISFPAAQQQILRSVHELLRRRYQPKPFGGNEYNQLQTSEARRGWAGFFERSLEGCLNQA
jgi:sulfatase maturation enzyme AslB (radical SAM superfamily)